jgi:hypothetical protein
MTIRVYPTIFNSRYERPSSFFIFKTPQEIKDAGVPVKSDYQVWTHGVVAYYHGIAVSRLPAATNGGYYSDREWLNVGLIPAVDAAYLADPDYLLPGRGRYWYPDFSNAYKGRWEVRYEPAFAFSPTLIREALIYTLRAEEFVGIDPARSIYRNPNHPDGRPTTPVVPPTPPAPPAPPAVNN